jgi:plasmid stabilization system protein ParE
VKVELFPRAEADIIRQFRYYLVDQGSPLVAVRFREAVIESINHLKPHPRIGSLFRGSIPGLRSWPVRGFEMIRIYYLDNPGRLRVVRILHGKRDVRQMLNQEKLA